VSPNSAGFFADAGHGSTSPRDRVIRNDAPNSALAAVAPSTTTAPGRIAANSATSHGRHAVISTRSGVA
jgi:hypothetical protein